MSYILVVRYKTFTLTAILMGRSFVLRISEMRISDVPIVEYELSVLSSFSGDGSQCLHMDVTTLLWLLTRKQSRYD